jgi:hypothetical protein
MDLTTLTVSVLSSAGVSAGIQWLAKTLVQHRLALDLEAQKSAQQRELAEHKAHVEALVRRELELQLAEHAAKRAYEWDARKRLYAAIGPLRFQLLLACRALAGRLEALADKERTYGTSVKGYYGQSTLYRLLRPLAIAELIERQIAYADFAVDEVAIDILRFKQSAQRILSGHEVVGDHPDMDWRYQRQHAFMDSIAAAANALIVTDDEEPARPLRFDEFRGQEFESFEPFTSLLQDFSVAGKPLLWIRFVALANACNEIVNRAGAAIGFEKRTTNIRGLVKLTKDEFVDQRIDDYVERIHRAAFFPL